MNIRTLNDLNGSILPYQAIQPPLTSQDTKDRFYTPSTEEEQKFNNHVFECVGSIGEGDNKDLIFKVKNCVLQKFPTEEYGKFYAYLEANYPLTLLTAHIESYTRQFFGIFNPTERTAISFSSLVHTDKRLKWIEHVFKKLGFAILDDEGNHYCIKNRVLEIYKGVLAPEKHLPNSATLRVRLPTPVAIEKRWEQIRSDNVKARKYGITESNFSMLKERISIALTNEATDSLKFIKLLNEEHRDVVVDNGRFFMHDLLAHVIPTVAGLALEATEVEDKFRYSITKKIFDEVILDLRNRIAEVMDETIQKLMVEFLARLVDSCSASFQNCELVNRVLLYPNTFHNFVFAETPQYPYAKEWKAMIRSMFEELPDEVFQEKWQLAMDKWMTLCHQNPHISKAALHSVIE